MAFMIFPASIFAVDHEVKEPSQILFQNVKIFDGKTDSLISGKDVLVESNLIKAIGSGLAVAQHVQVIDGGGRTLMPGIIEGHGHLMLSVDSASWLNTHDVFYIAAAAAAEAEGYLMRGWTTVRDIGGPAEGIYRAVEDG